MANKFHVQPAGGLARRSASRAAIAGAALAVLQTLAGCLGGPSGHAPAGTAHLPPADRAAAAPAVLDTVARVPRPPEVLSVEPWSFGSAQGQIIRTAWYRLFTTESDPILTAQMPVFLEAALRHYISALADLPLPPVKLDVYLMADRLQWTALTRHVMGPDAQTYLRIPRGGFAAGGRAMLWTIGPRDTLAIAAHEGWHQYTQRSFRQPLPIWLEEGIATAMEGFRSTGDVPEVPVFDIRHNPERTAQLRDALRAGGTFSLEELLAVSPQELLDADDHGTLTYYAQVWALVLFLHDGQRGAYRDALRQVIVDAQSGRLQESLRAKLASTDTRGLLAARRGPAVFAAYFHADLPAAGAEYDRFIRDLAGVR